MCVFVCVCVCVCLRDSAAPSAGGCRNWLTTASRRLPDRRVQNVWSVTVYVRSVLITSTVDPSKAIHNTLVPISLEGWHGALCADKQEEPYGKKGSLSEELQV